MQTPLVTGLFETTAWRHSPVVITVMIKTTVPRRPLYVWIEDIRYRFLDIFYPIINSYRKANYVPTRTSTYHHHYLPGPL